MKSIRCRLGFHAYDTSVHAEAHGHLLILVVTTQRCKRCKHAHAHTEAIDVRSM